MHSHSLLARLAAPLALLLAIAASPTAGAAQGPVDHDQLWSAECALPGVGGPVHALLAFQDELIVGGEFQHVRGAIASNVARWNGAVYSRLGTGLPDVVHALAVHQGQLYAGGAFGVARWTGTAWATLPGLTLYFGPPEVFALASHGGELWVGGQFDQAGAAAVHGLARWNGASWSAPIGGGAIHSQQEPRVLALLSASNGRLYAGGEFERLGGALAANVAEYGASGTTWRALHTGTDRTVRSLAEFQGALFAGGDFDLASGAPAGGLARWNGAAWQRLGTGLTGLSGFVQVFGLREYAGSLVAAGTLATAGGAPASSIARWDGAAWHTLGGGIGNTPGFLPAPRAFAEYRGVLHVGGDFTRAGDSLAMGSAIVSHNLAAWDGASWSQVGPGFGTDGDVMAMTWWNGGLVVGGRFPLAGGLFAGGLMWIRGGQARWLGGFDGPVKDMVVWNGDLVVTGQFRQLTTATGPVFAQSIARFDGVRWQPIGVGAGEYCVAVYQGQLYAGGLGRPVRWTGTTWQTFGTSFGGGVTAMVEHQGALFVGGSFNGPGAPPNLARWDGATMTPVGTGVNGYGVGALASFGNDLIVGGTFSVAGGVGANNVAAWNGTSFRALGAGIPGSSVNTLAVLGTTLWVGGDLGQMPGYAQRAYVATWDGAAWTRPGRGPDGAVLSLFADPVRAQVWAGGWFFECSGKPAWYLARYDAQPNFQDLGYGSENRGGAWPDRPELLGTGLAQTASTLQLSLTGAMPFTPGLHVAGLARQEQPFFGGVLVPRTDATMLFFADDQGAASFTLPIPNVVPRGAELFWQCAALEPRSPRGVTLSNAIRQVAW